MILLLRFGLAALSTTVVWWAAMGLQRVSADWVFEPVSDRMLLGENYRPEQVARMIRHVEAIEGDERCGRPFQEAAVIRVRARQLALRVGDETVAHQHLAAGISDLEQALICSPAKAFSWLLLFTLRSTRDGNSRPHLPLLARSYQLAPQEGSISPLRARAALPLLSYFGPGMTAYVRNDFDQLARDQPAIAAEIYVESSPSLRATLAEYLSEAPAERRRTIVRLIEEADVAPPPLN